MHMRLDTSQKCQTDGFHTASMLHMHRLVCEFTWEFLKRFLKENMRGLKMETLHIQSPKRNSGGLR